MSAIELFQKTLEAYKIQLQTGRFQSLSSFCRDRHVDGRAMTRWINDQGIHLLKMRKELLPISPEEEPHAPQKMFSQIQIPESVSYPDSSELKDIRIETGLGLSLSIGTCSTESLVALLSHPSISRPCSH